MRGLLVVAISSFFPAVASAASDLAVSAYSVSREATPSSTVVVGAYAYDVGSDPALEVTLAMTVPEGVTIVSVDTTRVESCAQTEAAITCSAPSTGNDFGFEVTALAPDRTGPLVFDFEGGSASPDADLTNNHATAEVLLVEPYADLSIGLFGPDFVGPGQRAIYSLRVSNRGNRRGLEAPARAFVDYTLPEGSSVVAIDAGAADCVATGGSVVCDLGTIAPRASAGVTVTVTAPSELGAVMASSAQVTSDLPDPNPGNDTASYLTMVIEAAADLQVFLDAPGQTVTSESFVVTAVLDNNGPTNAMDASLEIALPAQATLLAIQTEAGASCTAGAATISCSIPTLQFTQYVTLVMQAPDTPGTLGFAADATSATPDAVDANNHATLSLEVIPAAADVAVYVHGPEQAATSEDMTLSVEVHNNGTTAHGATLSYALPPGTTYVASQFFIDDPCTESGGQLLCALGELAPGAFRDGSITITAPQTPGTMTSVVSVSSDTFDPVLENNDARLVTQVVVPSVDLLAIIEAPSSTPTGTPVSMVLVAYNASPFTARGVTLVATLPEGLGEATVTRDGGPAPCTLVGSRLECALDVLDPCNAAGITVQAVAPATPGTALVTVTVSSVTAERDPGNNTATRSFELVPPPKFCTCT
jgi:hypothetical protein